MAISKKIIEKILFIISCICFIFIMSGSMTYASENACENSTEYFTAFYGGNENILVTNFENSDMTNYFLTKTQGLYAEGNFTAIKDIIAEENLVLHIISDEVVTGIQPFAYDKFKSVKSDLIYFQLNDQNNYTSLGVLTELTGGIWYNEMTSQVTRVSNATYKVISYDTNLGVPIMANNFKTGSSVKSGKGYFWGECSFTAQLPGNQGGNTLLYGTPRASFYATP